MALYSKQQFATLCYMDTKKLAVYIGRGKVKLKDKEKCTCPRKQCECLIDSDDSVNKLFVEENMIATEGREKLQGLKKSKSVDVDVDEGDESEAALHKAGIYQLQKKKLVGQIEELKNKNLIYEGRIQKIYEEIIPREHASFLIINYSQGIKNVWLTATDRFVEERGAALGLSREEVIEHKQYINDIVNDQINKGAEEANKRIRTLARQYAGKKDRGEHD